MEKYSIIIGIKTFSTLKVIKGKKVVFSKNMLEKIDIHMQKKKMNLHP